MLVDDSGRPPKPVALRVLGIGLAATEYAEVPFLHPLDYLRSHHCAHW